MNIVDLLIEFRITQNKEILGNVDWIEQENLNVIAIEILSWLKLERKRELWIEEGKKTSQKPMELEMKYPWCNDLVKLLQTESPLSDVFCVKGNQLGFKENISEESIHELRRLAYEKYNPQLIVN